MRPSRQHRSRRESSSPCCGRAARLALMHQCPRRSSCWLVEGDPPLEAASVSSSQSAYHPWTFKTSIAGPITRRPCSVTLRSYGIQPQRSALWPPNSDCESPASGWGVAAQSCVGLADPAQVREVSTYSYIGQDRQHGDHLPYHACNKTIRPCFLSCCLRPGLFALSLRNQSRILHARQTRACNHIGRHLQPSDLETQASCAGSSRFLFLCLS